MQTTTDACAGSNTPYLAWVFESDQYRTFSNAQACIDGCLNACGADCTSGRTNSALLPPAAPFSSFRDNTGVVPVTGNKFCITMSINTPSAAAIAGRAANVCASGQPIWSPPTCSDTPPPAAASPVADPVAPPTPPGGAGLPGMLGLPDCATSHNPDIAGKCTLDDIKQVGVNFANFLMGLAAAFFLLIFVYAGCKYIFFAYDAGSAGEAQKMLTGAAIGMLLVLGAATIVRFVENTATGGAPTAAAPSQCDARQGYSCQNVASWTRVQKEGCATVHSCPGGGNIRCCPTATPAALPAAGNTPPPPAR